MFPDVIRSIRPLVLLALSAAFATGCVMTRTDTPEARRAARAGGGTQAEMEGDSEYKYFPKTVAALEKADEALTGKRYDEALASVRQAAKILKDESSDYGVEAREARGRLYTQIWVWEGLALRGVGRDMDALIAVGSETRGPDACRLDLRPRCNEYADWLKATFPGVINDTTFLKIAVTYPLPIGHDNNNERMDSLGETIRLNKANDKAEYAAVWVEPTSVKPGKNLVTLRADGQTATYTYEECVKTGTLRIGEANFDVKRCGDRTGVVHRADFTTTIPPEDAAKITGAKGERLLIVFQVKNFKKRGIVHDAGPARIAWLMEPRKK